MLDSEPSNPPPSSGGVEGESKGIQSALAVAESVSSLTTAQETSSTTSELQPSRDISNSSSNALSSGLAAATHLDAHQPATERPLNVTDALTYLDSVKLKFQDRPDVYNKFLDIMKDFKSQIIDTPGVIDRVSSLFHGHPSLIQGFNTFLPAGYRIDCNTDSLDPNVITVTTPAGTTTWPTHGSFSQGPSSPKLPASHIEVPMHQPSHDVNLEPALMYIQRVKTRYANEPDRYRKFLETLNPKADMASNYDVRELEHWAIAFLSAGCAQGEIVRSTAKLFRDAPSLMKELIDFLPNKQAQEVELARLEEMEGLWRTGTPTAEPKASRKKGEESSTGAASVTGSTVPQKRKRRPAEKEKEREKEKGKEKEKDKDKTKDKDKEKETEKEAAPKAPPSKAKRARPSQLHLNDASSPSLTQRHATAPSSPRRSSHAHTSQQGGHHHLPQPVLPPPIPVAAAPPPPLSSADEAHFFDRVKRAVDNRETYNEFLKLINLFTQDIIDTARLVRESRSFLGDGDLMMQFMDILGWDERRDRIAVADDVWTRPLAALDRPSRNQLNYRHGSYRKLPANEINVTCSGRDEMCRSVLNDEWISQPTFASEDAGFQAHKKNIYEEALHRSEEERHEYDFHLEAIYRTIHMLEPLNNKIAQLSPEERNGFKLKPNLGGAGRSIHLRVLKKIYGREAGLEVYQAMQEAPSLAIPVVLSRLKVKHEEWKRAQREWNKVWREVDARNYHKSLDHQGVTFKATDKKAITARHFLTQIETARDEQMAKRAALIDPLFARTRPRHQLEYVLDDMTVMQDAIKMTLSYLDRTQINLADRRKIETFIRAFVPLFLVQDPATFNCAFVPRHESADSDMDVDSTADDVDVGSSSSSARTGKSSRKAGAGSGDLRKKLLKNEQAKSSRRTRAQGSRPTSRLPSPSGSDVVMQSDADEGKQEHSGLSNEAVPPSASDGEKLPDRRRYSFYTNTTFYVFFRLLELLYSRLYSFRELATRIASDPSTSHKSNPVAADLGLLNDLGKFGDPETAATHFYPLLLESCEKLFDNEIEQHAFEDQLRWMFGPRDAYKMFTIDKVVGAVIKQVQNILSDVKSQELFELLRRDREITSPTTQDQINARRNTEKVIGPDENLFRMDWLPENSAVTVQLLGKDDSSFDDSEVLTGRWQAYIDSFVNDEVTKDVPTSVSSRRPFLRRSLDPEAATTDIVVRGGLDVRICVRTYRLFFVSGTEDALWNEDWLSRQRTKAKPNYWTRGHVTSDNEVRRQRWFNELVLDLNKKAASWKPPRHADAPLAVVDEPNRKRTKRMNMVYGAAPMATKSVPPLPIRYRTKYMIADLTERTPNGSPVMSSSEISSPPDSPRHS
ncbi:uncharacterized protein FIBRA_00028 [Fibroporia radiculosa]|uniref:Histone deacetylase interacting domain-containing protein n=1 Tax=Fibroporia radiculosa TaxID=599839 RepID=J7S5I4_9APHY|nr:uncharacterized protein FIBRA_00028 [Fibroporia radiculosa]CCL98034.1 predicted protein [Fibroporia radiculosa]